MPRWRRPFRTLTLATATILLVAVAVWAWPRWQRANDLDHLQRRGAIFDSRSRHPSWMKLEGLSLSPNDLTRLARIDSIEDLVLDESSLRNPDLESLTKLTHLRRLSLNRTGIGDEGLRHLSALPHLKILLLDSAYRVTDAGLLHIAALARLEEFSIRDTAMSLAALIALSEKHSTLQINSSHGVLGDRKLALSGTAIGDEGLIRLHDAIELEGLELPSRITDTGLVHLHGLIRLRFLVLAGTAITDSGLASLAKRLGRLEELDLSGCRQLTDPGLAVLSQLVSLRQLTLDGTSAGPKFLIALSARTQLESLSLGRCPRINDKTLLAGFGSGQWPRLKFLRLNGTSVTDRGIQSINLECVPALEGLDLQDTATTGPAIRDLRQRLPGCRVLR